VSGQTTLVSLDSDSTQGNGTSGRPSISADGRYVAFDSKSSNLVSGDTNSNYDVFVHDRQSGQTARVSVASDGTQGNNESWYPIISADGRYVSFHSTASNLANGDTNGKQDIFVHDRQTGQTTRVSVASDGTQGNNDSWYPIISADGRYVAFLSYANNLVSGDTNAYGDVFVHDMQSGTTTRISLASDGTQGDGSSAYPSISDTGRYVAFFSAASNLVSGDTNGKYDIFVLDRGGGLTTYSISGRVTDGSSNGISGVSVSDGAGHTATTDSSGNYTLSGLSGGTYTITPSKSGYTFSPASRAVTVPPDSTGQDFTGTIVPPTGKPVVVLVHGWLGLGTQVSCSEGITLYPDNQNFDGENGDTIGDLPDWLNSQGFEVWSAHLTTGPNYTASLRSNALCLGDQIAQVRSRAGGKVILIAHSMGGLVARAYMEDDGLYQNDVKTLITLGSPHQGVPVPWWDTVKRLVGLLKGWTCENQVAVCEFTHGIANFN
jgi:hypothetical protein